MNTSPYVDPRKSSQEVWEEFSMSFTPAVQEVVDFAKRIPGFRDLPENDQVSLLKAGTFEVSEQNTNTQMFSADFLKSNTAASSNTDHRIHCGVRKQPFGCVYWLIFAVTTVQWK